MTQLLPDRLQSVEVTDPQEAGGLRVFGLRWTARPLHYATLDESLAAQTFEVTEVSEGGSVPTLKVVNKGDTMVFLMAGEQLVGAKQNRVLNASIMVAARSDLPIPVSCVEAGRWAYRSAKFLSEGTSSHSALRHKMAKQVARNYRAEGKARSDQGEVWKEVSEKLSRMGSVSGSSALAQAYEDTRARLDDVLKQLAAPSGCAGAVFTFGGRIAGVDLFDQPATLAKLWPKLVRAYAIDALEAGDTVAPVGRDAVLAWLHSAAAARAEPFKSAGLGDDVRLEGPNLVGAGLVVEEQPVHVELFAEPATPAAAQQG
jgi:hypothetical protein